MELDGIYIPDPEILEILADENERQNRSVRNRTVFSLRQAFSINDDGAMECTRIHGRVGDQALPRNKRGITSVPKDKHARYRLKLREEGRCPRCGKPAWPYFECADHRASRKTEKRKWFRKKRGLPVEYEGYLPRGRSAKGDSTHQWMVQQMLENERAMKDETLTSQRAMELTMKDFEAAIAKTELKLAALRDGLKVLKEMYEESKKPNSSKRPTASE